MLSCAKPEMIPALTHLWQRCFGDSEAYIAFFMAHRFVPEQTIVWLENGTPVGAMYLLPCRLEETAALYAYAVAVDPAWQRNGICAAMLDEVENRCTAHQTPLLGTPRQGMEGYYRQRGYRDAFFCHWQEFAAAGPALGNVTELDAETCTRLREAGLPQRGLVRWDTAAVAYALAEQRFCGGFAHRLSWSGGEGLVLGRQEGDRLVVTETTLPPALLPRLCGCYHAKTILCRLPAGPEGEMAGVCFGAVPPVGGWLGLELT